MAVKVKERRPDEWWVYVEHRRQRKAKLCGEGKAGKRLAEQVRDQWDAHLKLGQIEKVFAPKVAAPVTTPASAFPKLRDALPEWIGKQETAGEIRGATPSAYLGRLRRWVFEHELPDGRKVGDLRIHEVTREILGGVIQKVKAAGKSVSVVEHCRMPLRGFYREQVELKVLSTNPADDLGFFVGRMKRKKKIDFFTEDEGTKLISAARALCPRWVGFIMTGLLAGLRWGEIAALYKTDVDFKKGRIHVQQSWSPKARALQPPKNGKDRYVKASPALLDALRAQIETVTLEAQAAGWDTETRLLMFPTVKGSFTHSSHFAAVWRPLLKQAGLRYRSFHCTRHSYATWLLEGGADIRWVQGQLGHASIAQTADTYGHCVPERHEGAVDKLDALVGC